jgi:pimeloyl-ACP methyl ester carboxylesterase
LQHGFTSSIDTWYRNGYVDALKGSYRLILIDARGHGRSDKPHESAAYAYERRAEDVLTVLDDLGVARAHYVGYSMGGRIGYALAQHWLDRFFSLAMGGAAPYARDPSDAQRRYVEPFRQGMAHHLAQREAIAGPFPDWRKAELLADDPEAMIAAALAGPWEPSREAMLPKIDVPCLLYVGEADDLAYEGMKGCVGLIPDARLVIFPALDHVHTNRRADLVVPYLLEHLARAGRGVAIPVRD